MGAAHEPFLAHRPSGVSCSATWGSAARAPWISCLRRYVLPRSLPILRSFGLPPVVNCRGTMPSQAERSRHQRLPPVPRRRARKRRSHRTRGSSQGVWRLRLPSPSGRTPHRKPRSADRARPIVRERRRPEGPFVDSIPLRLARPSARPGIAEASACPAARPSRVQAGWRAAD